MRNKLLVATLALAATTSFSVWDRADAGEKPAGAATTAHGVKVVGVEAVSKAPRAHAGRVGIQGVVAKVLPERGAFTLIDVAEFETCKRTGCAEHIVPVRVPRAEFKGELPKVQETVVVIGDVQPTATGYNFVVAEVRRADAVILSRTKAAQNAGTTLPDAMPATLLANKAALGLTAAQIAKLNALHSAFSKVQSETQERITHCQAELVEMLEQKPVNQAKVDHEKAEVNELKGKLAEARRKAESAACAVLTTEQRRKVGL